MFAGRASYSVAKVVIGCNILIWSFIKGCGSAILFEVMCWCRLGYWVGYCRVICFHGNKASIDTLIFTKMIPNFI